MVEICEMREYHPSDATAAEADLFVANSMAMLNTADYIAQKMRKSDFTVLLDSVESTDPHIYMEESIITFFSLASVYLNYLMANSVPLLG